MNVNLADLVSQVRELIVKFGFNILAAIAILVIGIWVSKLIRRILARALQKRNIDKTLITFLLNLLYFLLLTVVVVASLANLASGVLLIIFRPFEVDDFVCIAGEEGFVEKIHIFTTQIRTFDNRTIIVPNSTITSGKIINYTAKEIRRVDLSIGISYGANIKKAMDAITDLSSSNPKVLKDPAPYVGVIEYGDSSINLTVRPWCKTGDYWDVFFAINEQMKPALDSKGITIPFPQRDVHLYQHKD